MRVERCVTSVSWIPREAVVGLMASAFRIGVAHYDEPPPDRIESLEEMRQAGTYRFANELRAWVEIDDNTITAYGQAGRGYIGDTSLAFGPAAKIFTGVKYPELRSEQQLGNHAVRFVQTAGGRTGAPLPHAMGGPPFLSMVPPAVWTTLALTIHADGRHEHEVVGASPFPRHWIYEADATLCGKVAVADYATWAATIFGNNTPWGGHELDVVLTELESPLEHQLSVRVMGGPRKPVIRRLRAGQQLVRQGQTQSEIFLILNGLLAVDVDGEVLVQVGPGSIVGERARLGDGRRTASLTATTPATVAATSPDEFDLETLQQLVSQEQNRPRPR
jgi:Cyclic nucleotide-binding domain